MLEMVANIVVGVVLVAAGIVMLVIPGPGLLVIAVGLALILSQYEWGRRVLARVRLRLRDRFGSSRVQAFEQRVPKHVFPPADTGELRLTALRRSRSQDETATDDDTAASTGGRRVGRA